MSIVDVWKSESVCMLLLSADLCSLTRSFMTDPSSVISVSCATNLRIQCLVMASYLWHVLPGKIERTVKTSLSMVYEHPCHEDDWLAKFLMGGCGFREIPYVHFIHDALHTLWLQIPRYCSCYTRLLPMVYTTSSSTQPYTHCGAGSVREFPNRKCLVIGARFGLSDCGAATGKMLRELQNLWIVSWFGMPVGWFMFILNGRARPVLFMLAHVDHFFVSSQDQQLFQK